MQQRLTIPFSKDLCPSPIESPGRARRGRGGGVVAEDESAVVGVAGFLEALAAQGAKLVVVGLLVELESGHGVQKARHHTCNRKQINEISYAERVFNRFI